MLSRLGVLLFSLALGLPFGAPGGHYVPHVGDAFHYTEVVSLEDGYGNYSDYTETTTYTGNETVTAVASNGTDSAYYAYTYTYENSTDTTYSGGMHGSYTFSAVTFRYVEGTDDEPGFTNQLVWFYMNNSLPVGASFQLLDTQMFVVSRSTEYSLGTAAGANVETIFGEGNGSYVRDDVYGVFNAVYNWKEYFDPTTGYVVAYSYTEQDSNSSAGPDGSGFTWTDSLLVTSTSYVLTPWPSTASSSSGSALSGGLIVILAVVVVVVIVLAVLAWALSARRRHRLPEHSTRGHVQFTAPPAPPTLGPPPPPISLTPSGQPAVQQIVVKETVKVNCRYCGSLIDSTAEKCPFCGATRT